MKITFFLKGRKNADKLPVVMKAHWDGREPLIYQTGKKCKREDWVKIVMEGAQEIKRQRLRSNYKGAKDFNDDLDELEDRCRAAYRELCLTHIPGREELRKVLSGKDVSPESLIDHLDIMQAERSRNGMKGLRKAFGKWGAKHGKLRVDNLHEVFFHKFILFLASDYPQLHNRRKRPGLLNSTINEMITLLKYFCKWLVKKKLLRNFDFQEIRKLKVSRKKLGLTLEELNRFRAFDFHILLDLSERQIKRYQLYQDMYTIGFFTALRISDMRQIRPESLGIAISKGKKITVLELTQKKVKEELIVPMNDICLAIFKKYGGVFPIAGHQMATENLKEAFRLAGFTKKVIVRRIINKDILEEEYEEWELLYFHSSRASAATFYLDQGIPIIKVMKLMGHKNIATTQRYDYGEQIDAVIAALDVVIEA